MDCLGSVLQAEQEKQTLGTVAIAREPGKFPPWLAWAGLWQWDGVPWASAGRDVPRFRASVVNKRFSGLH
jgi:hypothetical protein